MNRPLGYENPNDDRWGTIRSNRLEIVLEYESLILRIDTIISIVKTLVWHSFR